MLRHGVPAGSDRMATDVRHGCPRMTLRIMHGPVVAPMEGRLRPKLPRLRRGRPLHLRCRNGMAAVATIHFLHLGLARIATAAKIASCAVD